MENSNTNIGSIYGLSCSCEPEHIRYVGRTGKPIGERLAQHMNEARRSDGQTRKLRWIRKHETLGHEILASLITDDLRSMREIADFEVCIMWVYSKWGHDLTNSSTLDGQVGPHSAETRARIAASHRGRITGKPAWNRGKSPSTETRAKQSAAKQGHTPWNRGTSLPPNAPSRAKMSDAAKRRVGEANNFFGKTHSPETRAAISLARASQPDNANHKRWHVNRNIVKADCALCA